MHNWHTKREICQPATTPKCWTVKNHKQTKPKQVKDQDK